VPASASTITTNAMGKGRMMWVIFLLGTGCEEVHLHPDCGAKRPLARIGWRKRNVHLSRRRAGNRRYDGTGRQMGGKGNYSATLSLANEFAATLAKPAFAGWVSSRRSVVLSLSKGATSQW